MNESKKYHPTIGLEVHAELKTRTKMFCDSLNDPDEKHANVNVCPVCLGHPGSLPVPNKQAIEFVLRVGLATSGTPNEHAKFDRKNYFYPDLPKAYQISQSGQPLVIGGTLRSVKINHIHLEEDAGKLVHDESGATGAAAAGTLVDYNRASVPLMELVTEPDLHSAEDAVAFMKELQLILRYLGVSDADLERGQMRADANISIAPMTPTTGSVAGKLGTRAEVKNLNSFNSVAQAINYEIRRQTEILERGEKVAQETRGWDEAKQKTTSQRSKEEAQDYRYFPEPDIPPFETSVFDIERLREELPELPAARRVRFAGEYNLDAKQTEILVSEPVLANFFEEAISELKEQLPKGGEMILYNYLTSDLRGLMNQAGTNFADLKITPEHLAHLAALLEAKKLTSRQAKDILAKMFETGADPTEIVASENIGVSDDSAEIEAVVAAVIAENKSAADDYRGGKTAVLQFLIGQAMKALKGRARPEVLKEMFEKGLGVKN
jgi:aspartyl-tRNA(Asn)/glutamyl-tRNA(Gln) amidotransferase subunit B